MGSPKRTKHQTQDLNPWPVSQSKSCKQIKRAHKPVLVYWPFAEFDSVDALSFLEVRFEFYFIFFLLLRESLLCFYLFGEVHLGFLFFIFLFLFSSLPPSLLVFLFLCFFFFFKIFFPSLLFFFPPCTFF